MGLVIHHNKEQPFKFNQKKAIQAVAFLLKQNPETNKSDNYMRLLKLLYFADRKSLEETGKPITGDRFVALPHGPTLSTLLDLVKQEGFNNDEWNKYIQKDGYNIRMVNDPGNDELCHYEMELLSKIWQQYREIGEWALAIESEQLPEFTQNHPGESSKSIPLSDVLKALGKAARLDDILNAAEESAEIDRILGTNH
jgi:uncharacterized phage-associated protein